MKCPMHHLWDNLCLNFKYSSFIHIGFLKYESWARNLFFNYLQRFVYYMSKALQFMLSSGQELKFVVIGHPTLKVKIFMN
jgi:hypothetical protein